MKDRIRCIMDYVQLSQQDFANKLNISPASLSSIFTGRTNPTNNHVMAIHRAFPNVNISWLMFGEGEMLSDVDKKNVNSLSGTAESDSNVSSHKNTSDENNVNKNWAANSLSDIPSIHPVQEMNVSSNDYGGGSSFYGNQSMRNNLEMMARVKMLEKKERKIKEIRVFYDDGTYESFVPSTK